MPSILDSLPSLYRQLLPSTFETAIPDETKATCSSCAMCASSCKDQTLTDAPASQTFFEPSTKCCTFYPNLPNYLVGAILNSEKPEHATGRKKIEEKVAEGIGATPYGLAAPAKYTLLYQGSREFFGRATSMRCPYYVDESGGLCSIWMFREAVCSTYFCKHVSGADGRRFWMSLKTYLALIEQQLSRYAIYQLYPDYLLSEKHPSEPPARRLEREELEDRAPSEETRKSIWGNWKGLEREFYEECHRLVSQLTHEDVARIAGFDGSITLAKLEKHLNGMLNPKLPEKLKLNPDLTIRWLPSGEFIIGAYSELDALALPTAAHPLLQEFRGDKTVSQVRDYLRKEKQADFSDEVLLSLYQHRVLMEA